MLSRIPGKLFVAGAAVALAAWAWESGLLEQVDLAALAADLRHAGPAGALLFLLAFSLIQPLHVSGHLFVLTASAVWSPLVAIPLFLLGTAGAATVAFAFARYVGRDAVQKRIPARLRRYDAALADNGLRTVVLLRLLFYTTPAVSFMLGVSRVRLRDMVLGTLVGNLPMVVLVVVAGDRLSRCLGGT